MRCPKCGYISFDHLEVCRRCNKALPENLAIEGTTFAVSAPLFLKDPVVVEVVAEAPADTGIISGEETGEVTAARELETLLEDVDDDLEIVFDDLGSAPSMATNGMLRDDEPKGEIELPFDLLSEDMLVRAEAHSDERDEEDADDLKRPSLDLPPELADISDLAPPDQDESGQGRHEDVGDGAGADAANTPADEDVALTFDDLEFSELLAGDQENDLTGQDVKNGGPGVDFDLELEDLTLEIDHSDKS